MKNVVLIDDSQTIRKSLNFVLKEFNVPVHEAENGQHGLEVIEGIKNSGGDTALVVVDVNMPVMDGITFVKEFRKTDKFTPVLFLTTESEEEKIREGKDAGATGWMIKPFKPDEIKTVVGKYIK